MNNFKLKVLAVFVWAMVYIVGVKCVVLIEMHGKNGGFMAFSVVILSLFLIMLVIMDEIVIEDSRWWKVVAPKLSKYKLTFNKACLIFFLILASLAWLLKILMVK